MDRDCLAESDHRVTCGHKKRSRVATTPFLKRMGKGNGLVQVPDLVVVLGDGAVGREGAGVGDIDERLAHPGVLVLVVGDRKSTRLNSSHPSRSRMPSSA